jgi:hypothetical protein
MSDTIIFDRNKRNAELLTIHADGRITVAEHLKPTETAAAVLQIIREQWMDDIQSKKIREQEDRTKRLEEALHRIANTDYRGHRSTESQIAFQVLTEAKP